MRLNLQQKIQAMKQYYSGESIDDVVRTFPAKYGHVPTTSGLRLFIKKFEKDGCLKKCGTCSGYNVKKQLTDEEELDEIMICAAAELELSARAISLELCINTPKVYKILKKNGYSITNFTEEKVSDDEKDEIPELSDKRKRIIRGYLLKNTLTEMIQLFNGKFKNKKEAKEEILNIIQQFELYGCIRDCKVCMQKINQAEQLKLEHIEELISNSSAERKINRDNKSVKKKVPSEEYTNKEIESDCSADEPINKKIKLECGEEPTTILPIKSEVNE